VGLSPPEYGWGLSHPSFSPKNRYKSIVREAGYSGAEVARYLGVTHPCVTRIVASGTKPPVEELIKEL